MRAEQVQLNVTPAGEVELAAVTQIWFRVDMGGAAAAAAAAAWKVEE